MKKIHFLSSVLFTVVIAQLEVNDPCGPTDEGRCVLVKNCPRAMKELMATAIRKNHTLERCGWMDKDELVCCINDLGNSIISRLPNLTKTEEACMKYGKGIESIPFITNGVDAPLKKFPHMAALGYNSTNSDEIVWGKCGGSLISENYVLTAGHCLFTSNQEVPVMVRLGKIDLFGNDDKVEAQDIPVSRYILVKSYQHIKKFNDIGLIRLVRSAVFNDYVNPICLYTKPDLPASLIITGWGATKTDDVTSTSKFLQEAFVKPVDLGSCNDTYQKGGATRVLIASQLCARSTQNLPSDTCKGDSGGPIQAENRELNGATPMLLVGITSFGRPCGSLVPSVYTRVYSYLKWIEEEVWPNEV